jgi:hypothetical protein
MQRIATLIITISVILWINGCSSEADIHWINLLPQNSSVIFVPEQGVNVQDLPAKEYASYLDDLATASIQQISGLSVEIENQFQLIALALYPSTSTESGFLWIADAGGTNLEEWAKRFYQPFTQNNYEFSGHTIHKLFFNNNEIFATQIESWLLISESSLAIENAIRTSKEQAPAIQFSKTTEKGTFIVNTPELDHWIEQYAEVAYRPALLNKFEGSKPFSLSEIERTDSERNIQIDTFLPLKPGTKSPLMDAISYSNKPVTLDQHIASTAAAFAILRLPPLSVPAEPFGNFISPLDSLLQREIDTYQNLANQLGDEFAFESFPESGLLSTGEFLFMRKLRDRNAFQQQLNQLVDRGYLSRIDNSYQASSSILGQMIGSELSTLRDFYIGFSNDVVVISKRKGLSESVNSDRIRRRVIYYEDSYSEIRNTMPDELSGFFWGDSERLMRFLNPYLKSDNNLEAVLRPFDITTLSMQNQGDGVDVKFKTYSKEGSVQPYDELWVVPLANADVTGTPVLGNMIGSPADEVIFSTDNGRIYVLAADGTTAMQASTNGVAPIGGPQLYDWYGNGSNIIFLAAGSQIFAWNEAGDLLPQFPIQLNEQITAPILIQDVLRNGVPEIVVATDDRKIHVLDARGENVRGWPKNTNAIIQSQPVFETMDGTWSIWAYAENALHSWLRNGDIRPGYPQFVNARFNGTPVLYDNQVIGGAADGYLYSVGTEPFFNDSLATIITEDSISIRSLYVSNSELMTVSLQENVLLKDSTNFYREDLLATQSTTGSLFLYNLNGALRFTQSLGQPASSTFSPALYDINGDLNQELLALADFGRLYAWEVLTEKRLYNIPTSGMKYPLIADLNGDGQKELIAQTREGLRCWTINQN